MDKDYIELEFKKFLKMIENIDNEDDELLNEEFLDLCEMSEDYEEVCRRLPNSDKKEKDND